MAISIIGQSIRKPFYIGPCVPSIDHGAKSSHHNFVKCNNCAGTDIGQKGSIIGGRNRHWSNGAYCVRKTRQGWEVLF